MSVHYKRHLAKTVTYRLFGSATTFAISFCFTGSWAISGSISFVELVVKPINYFLHERVWYKYVSYGLQNAKN